MLTGRECSKDLVHTLLMLVSGRMEGVDANTACAVKVFKTRLAEFKTRDRYIKDDHRYKDRLTKTNTYSVSILCKPVY